MMRYRYWFACTKGGNVLKRKLLCVFGTAQNIWAASPKDLGSLSGASDKLIDRIVSHRNDWDLEERYRRFEQTGLSLITLEDCGYPERLKEIRDAPYGLFYRGILPNADEKCIAMVGARRPSAYGQSMAKEIAKTLAQNGFSVVSGLALGIDGASHEGAISGGGRTYAFLGCGADVCYPKRNEGLYNSIQKNGAVLSEFSPGTQPVPANFPARNRLISGLCSRVIVVEARRRSGSLITADFALEQGRDVYALPGRVGDPLSEGTNRLIAQGAGIITSKEELLADFCELPEGIALDEMCLHDVRDRLTEEERRVYDCFDFYAKGLDAVQRESGLSIGGLIPVVVRLCTCGYIREVFKNQYVRTGCPL